MTRLNRNRDLKIVLSLSLVILFFFLGCKKKEQAEDPCKQVIQGDFELVE